MLKIVIVSLYSVSWIPTMCVDAKSVFQSAVGIRLLMYVAHQILSVAVVIVIRWKLLAWSALYVVLCLPWVLL